MTLPPGRFGRVRADEQMHICMPFIPMGQQDVNVGTDPEGSFARLNTLAKTIKLPGFPIPRNVDYDLFPELTMQWLINATSQVDGDVLNLEADYRVIRSGLPGSAEKAGTNVTASTTVTTAGGLARFDPYDIVFNFDPLIPANTWTEPSLGNGTVIFEFNLLNTAGVGNVLFVSGQLRYFSKV